MDAAKIRIAVEANSAGVGKGLAAGNTALAGFQANVARTVSSVNKSFASLSTGQKILGGIGIGIGLLATGMAKVIGPAIAFESAFAGVLKTVDGTPEQLDAIRQGILDMSAAMPTAADELASIAENAGQLGVAAPDVLKFTETIAMLGETTDLDFDQAAQSLARFLNITDGGAANIDEVADVIVALGNNSATTESQIVSMATRLAASFSAAGATKDEILAVAAALSSLGVEAEAGGSAASRIITEIADASKLGGEELQIFADTAGLLPEQFAAIAEESPVEAMVLFAEGLQDVIESGGSITPILDDLGLSGIRVRKALELMALGSDQVRESLGLAEEQVLNGGAAYDEFGRRLETTASRIDIFKNRMDVLAISLGTPLLDSFARAVDGAGDAIEAFVQEIGPAAAEIAEFLEAVAEAGGEVLDFFGAPVLKAAGGLIVGIAASLEALFGALNSTAGAAEIATGAIAAFILVQSVGGLAAIGKMIATLAVNYALVGGAATAAAVGASALRAAMAVGPFVLAAGAMIGLGQEIANARDRAQELRTELELPLENGPSLQAAQDYLLNIENNLDRNAEAWDRTGNHAQRAFNVIRGMLPGVASDVVELKEENEALNDSFDANGPALIRYQGNLERLAEKFGISVDQAEAYVMELGLAEEATGHTPEYWALEEAVGAIATAHQNAADEIGTTVEELEEAEGAMASATEVADDLEKSVNTLRSALEALAGNGLDVRKTMLDLEDALVDIQEKLQNTEGYKGSTDAMRDLISAGETSVDLLFELAEAGDYVPGKLGLMRAEFVALAQQMGFNSTEAQELANELFGMPGVAEPMLINIDAEADEANRVLEDTNEQAAGLDQDRTIDVYAVDNATGDLSAIEAALARIRDKTVTVSTEYRTPGGGRVQADGGFVFAGGGFIQNQLAKGAVLSKPGTAGIYAPTTVGRLFAEPVTGGEAYIPLASAKRARSKAIWRETGKRIGALDASGTTALADGGILGRFASGGITTGSFSNGPGELPGVLVDVRIDATSMGQVDADLGPAEASIKRWTEELESAEIAARYWARETGESAEDVIYTMGIASDEALEWRDSQVDAFGDVVVTLEDTGRKMLTALRPGEFLDTFSRISGWAKESFRDWLGEWDGTVESAIMKLEDADLELGHIFRGIAEEGAVIGIDLVDAFDEAGIEMSKIARETGEEMIRELDTEQFLVEFSRISGWGKDAFVDWLASVDESATEAVAEMREAGVSIDAIFADLFSNDEALERLEDAGLDVDHIFEQIFDERVSDVEIMDSALGEVEESMRDVEDATRSANDAFDVLTGTNRDLLDAQFDYLDAIDDVKEAIKGDEDDGPGVFGLGSEEARRNYQDLLDAGDAMRKYGIEIAGSGISASEAIEQFDALREEFRELAEDTGLPQAEVERLTDLLFKVPDITIAEIALEAEQAEADVAAYELVLDELGNAVFRPTLDADTELIDEDTIRILEELGLIDLSTPTPVLGLDDEQHAEDVEAASDAIDELDGKTATTVVENTIKTTQTVEFQGGKYTVQQGDSWWAMAAKLWGDPTRYPELAAKNNADPNATLYPGRVINYAAGGVEGGDVANGHQAGMTKSLRVFGEPETGGETYLPHANDWRRPQTVEYWRQTGRILGVYPFAEGGVVNGGLGQLRIPQQPTSAPSISIDVHPSPGMDERQLASFVGSEVRRTMRDAARDLDNLRRV